MPEISSFLETVVRETPYYKGHKPELKDMPIISRGIIEQKYEQFLGKIQETNKKEILRVLYDRTVPKASDNEICRIGKYIIEETSGTSGTPFRCLKSVPERALMGVELWKKRRELDGEINPKKYYQFNHLGMARKEYINPYSDNLDDIKKLYSVINENDMRWIHATPGLLLRHIRLLKDNGANIEVPSLKYLELTGHFYSGSEKEEIESFYKAKIINSYGSIETWPIAIGFGRLLKINDRINHVELIDENDCVITENNKVGRIVVTNLVCKTMPIVRYATGDFAEFSNFEKKEIIIHEGRDINLLANPGLIFGNVLFKGIMGLTNFHFPENGMDYVHFSQTDTNKFIMEINLGVKREEDISKFIKKRLEEELKIEVLLSVVHLSSDEVERRKRNKPEIFTRKCERK